MRLELLFLVCMLSAPMMPSAARCEEESLQELFTAEYIPPETSPIDPTVEPRFSEIISGQDEIYLDDRPPTFVFDGVRAGYDDGFVIASKRNEDLDLSDLPFRLKINGWGQIRHTTSDVADPNVDLNQFQLKRGRLIFSGSAFTPDFSYYIQLDGRSSNGDTVRLLDYSLSYDIGHRRLGLERGVLGLRTGKYKMPFHMARSLSGKEFEFTDRSMASTFFDVNRSFAWGVYGKIDPLPFPIFWEAALFNGLVTGGAETGSSGTLDDNFAFSVRAHAEPIGEWDESALADFEQHKHLAMRCGCGFATSKIDRAGTSEFNSLRVVDSGQTLASILPLTVNSYDVSLFSVDVSTKYQGWSTSFEYYFRTVSSMDAPGMSNLFDHGLWLQTGWFAIPNRLQLLTRWSHIEGNSGTLGASNQSSEEISGGLAWYFRENHAKAVMDLTYLDGASISSSSLDINPGDRGWLARSQIQFSF